MVATDGLWAELQRATTRSGALAAVACALGTGDTPPHAVRRALAAALTNGAALSFPSAQGARDGLDALDARLDRALRGRLLVSREPLEALTDELASCAGDPVRTQRSLAVAFRECSPPASRACATFVDLLRARDALDATARRAVYECLVDHGADIRGPLCDDARIDVTDRTRVLVRFAARRADAGQQVPVRFGADARRTLAMALTDWTRHATHPRQLFHGFYRAGGLDSRAARTEALQGLERLRLPVEVLAELGQQLEGSPVELSARPLSAGRYECARCGAVTVGATELRALDDGAELHFVCTVCDMAYFAAWDSAALAHDDTRTPRGWTAD